ncbi:hypothetical protein L2E82_33269 [Cichorium intybus]|uniref:Uncharacterized protein n=1 Tax=Cichorium intybus TaxID=13427 RepID=A0ACB9BJP4_CICIN|nr:hypothetical protein L2E82_33269 [Cichorium intybus]
MAKKRGLPDAHSDEFLSTIESAGAGSSGQGDMNIFDHGDSSATKVKLMKLNSALPVYVVPLSKLPFAEKKNWLLKFTMELDKVRTLQKRLDFHNAHAVRILSSRMQPRGAKNKGTFSLVLRKQCENLLKKLMLHRHGWMFKKPVDIVEFSIPDYNNVIKNPMDLGTIKGKLGSGTYSIPLDFRDDVRLVFTNAMAYNPPGNYVHVMAGIVSKLFEQKWKPIEKKLLVNGSQQDKVLEIDFAQEPVKLMMTDEEKRNISRDLEVHLDNLPDNIIDFLRKHASNGNQTGEDEIEVDIDAFDNDSLFILRKMLDDHVQDQQNHTEVEPSVIDESGISNSTLLSYKGNDADEDIDICGIESPCKAII